MAGPAVSQTALPGPTTPAAQTPADRADRRADLVHGRQIAITGGRHQDAVACARCHGADGAGDSSGAFPRLADQSAWYLYKTLQDYAGGLRPNPVMAPVARALAEDELIAVSTYYAAANAAPAAPPAPADVGLLQIGGAISARGLPEQGVPACAGCHGENGVGKAPFYPFIAGQSAAYLAFQLQQWKRGVRGGDPQNVMALIAQAMTDEQIQAVSVFLANVRGREITPDAGAFRPAHAVGTSGTPWTAGRLPGADGPGGPLGAPAPRQP
ncbi:c-type cytochrome [Aquabacter spiritensis]